MATYTANTFANYQPLYNENGVQGVRVVYNSGATAVATGDVILLAKIPHGALPMELVEDHSTGSTTYGIKFGLASGGPGGSATFSCYIASGAQATVNRRSVLGIPAQISASDTDPNRYGILSAKVATATTTTSLMINVIFTYKTDGSLY
jgi:hypothetical protein